MSKRIATSTFGAGRTLMWYHCKRCNSFGSQTYTITCNEKIKFKSNAIGVKYYQLPNKLKKYHWVLICDACDSGLKMPIPFSELLEKDIGIDYLYD